MAEPPAAPSFVLTVSSNKGGVGKTTVAANLGVYLRALREDLPVLLVGLDDQRTLDRMLALQPLDPGGENLKHGWAQRDLTRAIQLGEYGVHFVPSPPDVASLKARAEDPGTLRRILARTAWRGVVILDTKSDLEALTRNALHAADRVLVPVADWASLEEAARSFRILEREGLGTSRARVLFTLVDRRIRARDGEQLHETLRSEVRRRGWPVCETILSRSPRVEQLGSGTDRPLSILHHARGTAVHGQMRALTREVLADLDARERAAARRAAASTPSEWWGPRWDTAKPQDGGPGGPPAAGGPA